MPPGSFLSYALFLSTMWPVMMAQGTIPYFPTHVFAPAQGSNDSDLVYVLQPTSDQKAVQLLSLNLTTINSASPQYTVLYDDVYFASDSEAYVPMLNSNGSITVFTGNCHASQYAVPRLWSFQPAHNSSTGNGTWSSVEVNGASTNLTGPGYLAGGFAFNSSNDTSPEYYTFGGMCPFSSENQPDWTSNANYSNIMTALTVPNTSSNFNYIVQQTESSNSPIAEAGYTVTPLQKTSSTTSGGRIVQQESFLFIGGHTETAFLNMSTLALFSLPQASWSYISIGANLGSGRTDLVFRDTAQIEPRSGHSAVMSSDGSKIIVFGGWVGDTSTPADPQLAILEVSEDYGGSGEWTWSTPVPTGSGPGSGSGMFGHATTMLPGDVMMILGGYIIPASSTSKRSSSAGLESSSQIYLYNLTSNSWMPSYTAPVPSNTDKSSHGGALSSSGEKAGLGIGVSVAVLALICLGYIYWSRKRWSHRRRRDQELRKLALGAERSNIWGEPGVESSYRSPSDSALRNSILENVYFSGPSHQYSAVPAPDGNTTEAERNGLLHDVPSPSRGLRRSLSGRPQRVQSAGRYEDSRTGYGAGTIHPIDEREEFETPPEEVFDRRPESGSSESANNRMSDPFIDPPSPTRAYLVAFHENSLRPQEADGASVHSRKSSPDKTERTHSDLSESSRSGISELSIQRSNFGSQRRSIHLFQPPIPTLEPSNSNHDDSGSGRSSPEKPSLHTGRSANESTGMRWPFERSGTVDSLSTSASHHRRSPLEGDTLLGSAPEWSTPPESPSRLSDRENRSNNSNNNNSLTWMGSIRKTLSNARKVVLSGYGNSSLAEEHQASPAMFEITSPVDFDDDDNLSLQISRRASSASVVAHHQRRQQGPRDWAVEGSSRHSGISQSTSSPRRTHHTTDADDNDHENGHLTVPPGPDDDHHSGGGGGSSIHTDEDDWDVELAAEGRLVQITYTIPKERLRVVNAGAGDRVIGDDVSDVVSRTSEEER
ncbi:conserved hypothetical protein [Talaromyces stipitatus ATCC 10500]|uniref:Galactose oxidase n=1 Tax=Talaromyces stipitatus (strain ATCC 10500 / CBS 375.48 / QM 6759 / NRRL 1006) TaxID=441959 RepID=B8LU05_TALSN|nr:uncharacterized protein TSTA_072280 [Talaromyces stipitatus ATCC 10500]EED23835.1 conserved hypothetical protein [Talaromyces stipitatus ATCC 10500]